MIYVHVEVSQKIMYLEDDSIINFNIRVPLSNNFGLPLLRESFIHVLDMGLHCLLQFSPKRFVGTGCGYNESSSIPAGFWDLK